MELFFPAGTPTMTPLGQHAIKPGLSAYADQPDKVQVLLLSAATVVQLKLFQ